MRRVGAVTMEMQAVHHLKAPHHIQHMSAASAAASVASFAASSALFAASLQETTDKTNIRVLTPKKNFFIMDRLVYGLITRKFNILFEKDE